MKTKRIILPWLSNPVRDELNKLISKTVLTELRKRFWGDWASGSSAGGGNRIIVNDYRGLMLAIGTIRYYLAKHNVKLLYRGQSKDWELKPSLFRLLNNNEEINKNMEWNRKILDFLKDKFDNAGKNADFREALLQHYGMKTTWIDAVDHIQIACWFAVNDKNKKDYIPESKDHLLESDIGFIYVLGTPEGINTWAKYVDLREKPSEWLRPHVQQAYSISLCDPLSYGTLMNHLCIITFLVPKQLLKTWSNSDYVTEEIIYPHYNFDRGIKHYNSAIIKLNNAGISPTPPFCR
jgi:hypothetical protein